MEEIPLPGAGSRDAVSGTALNNSQNKAAARKVRAAALFFYFVIPLRAANEILIGDIGTVNRCASGGGREGEATQAWRQCISSIGHTVESKVAGAVGNDTSRTPAARDRHAVNAGATAAGDAASNLKARRSDEILAYDISAVHRHTAALGAKA